jgi:ABC-type multidrug transport system ATPase subunit
MLISTHEIEAAQNLFESVIILKDGNVVLREKTETMRESGKDIVEIFEEVVKK